MIQIYFCEKSEREAAVRLALKNYTGIECTLARTKEGKPYALGNPAYFSLSHSGGVCVIAVSDEPVGTDAEVPTEKAHPAVLRSFSDRERREISSESDFLRHWTAREAYAKMLGARLWDMLKYLEFYGGNLFAGGSPVPEKITFFYERGAIIALCAKNTEFEIKGLLKV